MMKIFSRDFNNVDIDEAMNGRNIHVVFVADSGPSLFMNHITGAGRLTFEKAARLASRVNRENETGTLHPDYKVTIVPLSVFNDRNDLGNREVMEANIRDVFLANNRYIKCTEIFFCFEQRPDFDKALAHEVLFGMEGKDYGILTVFVSIL
jgi:hypothetical protein